MIAFADTVDLQQHKHGPCGHLPYVPAEIFITDASGFHPSDEHFKGWYLQTTSTVSKMCWFFISDTFHEHNYGAKK